jgi:hypothetical protein
MLSRGFVNRFKHYRIVMVACVWIKPRNRLLLQHRADRGGGLRMKAGILELAADSL